MKRILFLIAMLGLLSLTQSGLAQYHWNAYNDFYFNSTSYANHSSPSTPPFPTAPSLAGRAWGYYVANANGYGYPTAIGSYFSGGAIYAMTPYEPQPLGNPGGQVGGGVAGSTDSWDAIGGTGLALFGGPEGLSYPKVGEYAYAWYPGAPGYGTSHSGDSGLYFEPRWLNNPAAEGIPCVVTWTAPSDGTYTFNGSFLIASNAGWSSSYAIVDSTGGVEVPTTIPALGSYNTFSFQKTLKARDVIQFQVGSGTNTAAPVGFNCDIQLVQVTDWDAFNDFYFATTNYANNSPGSYPPFASVPSVTGMAWGYYVANANLTDGYPSSIGRYFPPGNNPANNEALYAMSMYQPLGAGLGQVGGGVAGSQDAWDAIGGDGLARYGGPSGLGSPFLGEYAYAWYPGAPGYGTSHAGDKGIYLEPRWLGNPSADGIPCVVTWTAPSDGTYTFNGSFLIASNAGWSSAYAIVDSTGGVEVPVTLPALGSYNTFSFQKTLKARDVIQFQIGSGTNTAAPVGFNCKVHLTHLTDWNAYGDFYWDTATYQNNSPGSVPLFPPFPSVTGRSWGYYAANCNFFGGYPGSIGSYFGPGNNTAAGQVLMAMSDYHPLGLCQGQIARGTWDATGGSGFARYADTNGWGVSLGEYGVPWFSAAPGYGTVYATNSGLWLQAGWLGGNSSQGEGICPVVTWTAPAAGTYSFKGSFLIGNNGTFGPDGANCSYAIVDSLGGIEIPRTVVPQGTYNTFSFVKTFSAGDIIEFQVGTDYQAGAAVGFNCSISTNPSPPLLVSASRPLANAAQVMVKFDSPLYAPTANNAANYSINNGVAVMAAQLSPTDPTTVILTVAPGVNYPSVLTVNNVASDFGHLPVAPNSTATISVPLYVPSDMGVPAHAAQPSFSGSILGAPWQIGAVNYNPAYSNYYYTQVFVPSGGVLHCHATTNDASSGGDLNYLVYVDPAYYGSTEEVLMHMTIKSSSPDGRAVAGAGVCVDANPWFSSPPGGGCLRAVIPGYAGVTNYPFFLTCSDYIADNNTPGVEPYNLQWKVGGSYWLRIRQDDAPSGGIISTKAWLGDGSQPEPASWQSVWTDPGGVTRVGYGAIRAGFSGAVMDFDVDYFLVKAAGLPTITPELPASLAPRIDLGIAINGANAVLSWPAAVGNTYKLQSTGTLPLGWTNVTTSVVVAGDRNTVTVPHSGGHQFFRLSQ